VSEIDGVREVEPLTAEEEELSLLIRSAEDVRAQVSAFVHAAGHPLLALAKAEPTLEEAFLQLVGRDRGVQRGSEAAKSALEARS
jgi:hypothetical protein